MRSLSPPFVQRRRGGAGLMLLVLAGCGNLQSNQGDVSGGPGPIVPVGGSSGGGRSGSTDGGGGQPGAGGSVGPACLPPGASAACGSCEATVCTTNAFIYGCVVGDPTGGQCTGDGGVAFDAGNFDPGTDPGGPGQGIDWYHDCYNATGTAPAGPMQGAKNSDLCAAVVKCVHESGCDASDPNLPCYCGAGVSGADCLAPGFVPSGPCKNQIAYGAYSTDPTTIASRATDYAYPTGAALGLVLTCDYASSFSSGPCQTECLGGGDGGASCTVVTKDGGAFADSGSSRDGSGSGAAASAGQGGAGGAAGGGGGSAGACTTTYGFADATDCANCELNSDSSFCNPTLLSATLTEDDSGNLSPVGFGPDTLATTVQQNAAFAIIHAALALQCYSDATVSYRPANKPGCETQPTLPCVYPNLGCLLDVGTEHPEDLLSGNFATMPSYSALAEYEAAAIADTTAGPAAPDPVGGDGYGAPGGISVGASNTVLGAYISAQAFHPSSAIGMADSVLQCGLNAGCTACFNLTATTTCSSGAGGSAGASGAGGAVDAGSSGGSGGAGSSDGAGGPGGSTGSGGMAGASGGRGGNAGTGGLTCPDLDGDGIPDCQETLVNNPGFDSSTSGWTAEPGVTASWTSQDGTGNPSSGAIAVFNADANPGDAPYGTTSAGADQCVRVTAGSCYQVDVQALIPTAQTSSSAGFVLDEHTTSDCSQATATSFVSPQVSKAGAWQTISGTTTQIPLGVGSVSIRLVAVKPVAQASAEAVFDNVLLRATTCASP